MIKHTTAKTDDDVDLDDDVSAGDEEEVKGGDGDVEESLEELAEKEEAAEPESM